MTDQLNEQQNILKVFGEAFQSFFDNSGKKVNEDDGGGGEAPASTNSVSGMATIDKPFMDTQRRKINESGVELQKRINLPQIANHEDFIQDLTISGIDHYNANLDPNTLEPTQSEFNDEKVQSLVASGGYKTFPILISNDGYIVDGHHRWKASQVAGDQIDVLRIDKTYNDLADFLTGKSYIVNKGINEQKQGM